MNALDWVLAAILIGFTLLGFRKGGISQAFGIAGLAGGVLLSMNYYRPVSFLVEKYLPTIRDSEMVSFILLFLLSWLSFTILSMVVNQYFRDGFAGIVNRLLGGVLGFIKAIILSMGIIYGATLFLPPSSPLLRESILLPYVEQVASQAIQYAPKEVEDLFQENLNKLKRHWKQGSTA